MGGLMRDLDRDLHPELMAMALRFMRASAAERPLLQGVAAVYLKNGEYGTPQPVFGEIRNVFSADRRPFMDFLHRDGRQEYLHFDRVVSILESDQSSEYAETE